MYGFLFTAYASIDFCIQKWGSESWKRSWDQLLVPSKFGWKGTLIVLLGLTGVVIFEAAYRELRKQNEEAIQQRQNSETRSAEEVTELQAELANERAKNARPDIQGEIREVHISAAWEKAPIDCGSVVIVNAYFVNHSPAKSNIKAYELAVTDSKGLTHFSTNLVGVNHWRLGRGQRRQTGFPDLTFEKTVWEELLDLSIRIGTMPFESGNGQDGWLAFCMKDDVPDVHRAYLTIVDAFGGGHTISGIGPWQESGLLVEKDLG